MPGVKEGIDSWFVRAKKGIDDARRALVIVLDTVGDAEQALDSIDAGRVLVEGKSIHDLPDAERTQQRAAAMGFVFQAFNLIPVFTTVENVELPLLLAGRKEQDARSRAEETLARVGARHITCPPYTPRWNGKVERFIRTLKSEWADAHTWPSSAERSRALRSFVRYYNRRRPHSSLGERPPASVLNVRGQDS